MMEKKIYKLKNKNKNRILLLYNIKKRIVNKFKIKKFNKKIVPFNQLLLKTTNSIMLIQFEIGSL